MEAPNHRKLLWSKAMVVSVTAKGEARLRQVSAMETNNNEPLWTCRNLKDAIKTERRGFLGISLEET